MIYDINPDIIQEIMPKNQKRMYQTKRLQDCYRNLVNYAWQEPENED
jgi:hypothetical protein